MIAPLLFQKASSPRFGSQQDVDNLLTGYRRLNQKKDWSLDELSALVKENNTHRQAMTLDEQERPECWNGKGVYNHRLGTAILKALDSGEDTPFREQWKMKAYQYLDDAGKAFKKAIAGDPDNPVYRFNGAFCEDFTGARAVMYFYQAIQKGLKQLPQTLMDPQKVKELVLTYLNNANLKDAVKGFPGRDEMQKALSDGTIVPFVAEDTQDASSPFIETSALTNPNLPFIANFWADETPNPNADNALIQAKFGN